jgi:class 3 adenylate cyclase
MPTVKHTYTRTPADEKKFGKGKSFLTLPKDTFSAFGTPALGIGDIAREGVYVQALAAIVDLEGFTVFCNQADAHLIVPEFLKRYLDWVFATLKARSRESESNENVLLWGPLPIFVKFLGDGLLILWDTSLEGGKGGVRNLTLHMHDLTERYITEFLPSIRRHVSRPPLRLRCGIARGQVLSVGDDGDYVGSCINIAARLQKVVPGVTFAASRTGLDLTDSPNPVLNDLLLKRISLRGIGEDELVYVKPAEFAKLRGADRKVFRSIPASGA